MLKEEKKWQLHAAKAHLSHLVDLAEKGEPVRITRHGHEVAVLISKKRYDQLTKRKMDCSTVFFLHLILSLILIFLARRSLPKKWTNPTEFCVHS